MSDPSSSKIPILRGATIHGQVLMSVDGTIISIHGPGGPMTALWAIKDGRQIILPSATIMGIPLKMGKFAAWDGNEYVFRASRDSIAEDEMLMLIGRVKRIKARTDHPAQDSRTTDKPHDLAPIPNVKPGKPARFSASLHRPSAAQSMEAYMKKKGLDQTEFAIQAGTTDKTIRKFRQTGTVKRSILVGIAKAMGISKDELLS